MRVICTQMDKTGKPLKGSEYEQEWSGWHFPAIVSAILHDLGEIKPEAQDKPDEAYMRHLSDWLNSGDDITIIYLKTPYGLDIWQYDDEGEE